MDATISIDQLAPDFELIDGDAETHRLTDYRGQPVVLIFYPFAFSGVCTEEHACVMDVMAKLNILEAQVLGISVDSRFANGAFARSANISYPLLADFHPKGQVGAAYGVYDDEKGVNRRWVVVVDPEGRVAFIQQNEIGEVPDIDEIVAAVADAT